MLPEGPATGEVSKRFDIESYRILALRMPDSTHYPLHSFSATGKGTRYTRS